MQWHSVQHRFLDIEFVGLRTLVADWMEKATADSFGYSPGLNKKWRQNCHSQPSRVLRRQEFLDRQAPSDGRFFVFSTRNALVDTLAGAVAQI